MNQTALSKNTAEARLDSQKINLCAPPPPGPGAVAGMCKEGR